MLRFSDYITEQSVMRHPSQAGIEQELGDVMIIRGTDRVPRYRLSQVPVDLLRPKEHYVHAPAALVRAYSMHPAEVPPIAVTKHSQGFTIIDGHHRVLAAIQAGLTILWALILE